MSEVLSRISCPYSDCKKDFTNIYNLERHIGSVHLQLKNFKCSICAKHLSSKQNLTEHMFIHTGEKPFKCDHANCSQAFRQRCQLINHKKIHKELQKFIQEKEMKDDKKVNFTQNYELLQDKIGISAQPSLKTSKSKIEDKFLSQGKITLPLIYFD